MPTKFKGKYRIQSARHPYWDYTNNGAYFVTVCTKGMEHTLGEIKKDTLIGTPQSKIIQHCWLDLPNHYPNCILDAFVIMPNHIHGIVIIDNDGWWSGKPKPIKDCVEIKSNMGLDVETGLKPVSTAYIASIQASYFQPLPPRTHPPHSLSEIMRAFKTFSTRRINEYQSTPNETFWQPRFHDKIIRNERMLQNIRHYIINNPQNWKRGRNNINQLT